MPYLHSVGVSSWIRANRLSCSLGYQIPVFRSSSICEVDQPILSVAPPPLSMLYMPETGRDAEIPNLLLVLSRRR